MNHPSLPRSAAALATLSVTAAVAAAPAQADQGPSASAAQAGCVLKSLTLKPIHIDTSKPPEAKPLSGAMFAKRPMARTSGIAYAMIFKASYTCTSETSWKLTMQIRRRRVGPDKNVAYKQIKGKGSKTYTIGADCKKGQKFNGNFTLNFLGANQTATRKISNKECK